MVGLERVELSSTDYESAALTVVLKAWQNLVGRDRFELPTFTV